MRKPTGVPDAPGYYYVNVRPRAGGGLTATVHRDGHFAMEVDGADMESIDGKVQRAAGRYARMKAKLGDDPEFAGEFD